MVIHTKKFRRKNMPNRVLDESKRKTERVMFALSKDDRERLERICLTLDITISQALRDGLDELAKKHSVT